MSSSILAAIKRVQSQQAPLAFVHKAHDDWPAPLIPSPKSSDRSILRISILDSSFNPPTRAHLALALSRLPSTPGTSVTHGARDEDGEATDYDARLLLFSVRNADKLPKPGDASHAQRIEMAVLMAQNELAMSSSPSGANVAVALIDEPTFVGKASIVRSVVLELLSSFHIGPHSPEWLDVELTFLLGFDTLMRLLEPRYYSSVEFMRNALRTFLSPPPEGDNCRVVCSRRAGLATISVDGSLEKQVMECIADLDVASERVQLCDIGREEQDFSSTAIRTSRNSRTEDWKAMVPNSVAQYLIEDNLYITT